MAEDDSDYELMPKKEIEQLRREISSIKKNPYGESDRGKDLQQSVDRLNNTINKLISILEDAQQDIIDEYQESKPVEKLNQILEQNETIAKALVSVHDDIDNVSQVKPSDYRPISIQNSQIPRPEVRYSPSQMPQQMPQFTSPSQSIPQMSQFSPQPSQTSFEQQPQQPQQPMASFNSQLSSNSQFPSAPQLSPTQQLPPVQQFSPQSSPPYNFQRPQAVSQMPDFAPLPPLDSIDLSASDGLNSQQMNSNMLPEQRKKKFLGII